MSVQCPCRHVSYAQWRLRVLRNLCHSFEPREQQHKSRAHPRFDPRRPAAGLGRTFKTLAEAARERTNANTNEPNHATTAESSIGEGTKQKEGDMSPPRRGKVAFNPYSAEGIQKIRQLQGAISQHLQGDDDNNQRPRRRRDRNESDNPPTNRSSFSKRSPVFSHVQKTLKRLQVQKRAPTRQEREALENNPWARLLASPLRACQASGAKLPKDLLVDLGYVFKPDEEKVYLMPAALADLDGMEARMARELSKENERQLRHDGAGRDEHQTTKGENTVAAETITTELNPTKPSATDTARSTDSTRTTPHSELQKQQQQQPRSRVLSDLNFLHFLTLNLTEPSKADPTICQPVRRKAMQLIHFSFKAVISLAQHYTRNQREVDMATGQNPAPTPNLEKLYLQELQWQPDMPDRLARIMRKRVLVALRALLAGAEAPNQDHGGRKKNVFVLPVPEGGRFNGDELDSSASNVQPETSETGSSAVVSGKVDEGRPMSSTAAPARETVAEEEHPPLGHPDWRPGSVLLHVGDGDLSALLAAPVSDLFPPLPASNPLIPPMVGVADTFRFPVFPLSRMLAGDHGDLEEFRKLVSTLTVSGSSDSEPTIGSTGDDRLILVRPAPGPPSAVVQEVWRLWRYLGGARMGRVSVDTDTTDPAPELGEEEEETENLDDEWPPPTNGRRGRDGRV